MHERSFWRCEQGQLQELWDNEAKEVHVRVACPPLMFPCRYTLSTRSIHEPAARRATRALEGDDIENVMDHINTDSEKFRKMVEWIKDDLGFTSLKYQTINDMVRALTSRRITLPRLLDRGII